MTAITTGKSLQDFLQGVIDESLKSKLHHSALQEKEKQNGTSGNSSNSDSKNQSSNSGIFSSDNGGQSNDTSGQQKSDDASKTGTDSNDDEAMKSGDVNADSIIEKLNSIRSGKSFKDESVASSMTEYIGSLSDAERTALFAFLKGIAQIVTGEIPAQQATEPKSNPADVTMQKGANKQHKTIKPNVIKTAAQDNKQPSNSKGQENTKAPSPITPKKR